MIVPAGSTAACRHAQRILAEQGFTVVDHPTPEATHLLLDVPSFEAPGRLRGGGELSRWLEMLPPGITVIGGNLDCSELAGYPVVDLLRDAQYVAQNAAITAHCALEVAAPLVETTLADGPSLIVGWGRIGKCLASCSGDWERRSPWPPGKNRTGPCSRLWGMGHWTPKI